MEASQLKDEHPAETLILFKYGKDDHISIACSNNPNSVLIHKKSGQLRAKQRVWEAKE